MVFLDHIHIDVFGKSRFRSVMELMSSCVHDMMLVEFLEFINEFIKG